MRTKLVILGCLSAIFCGCSEHHIPSDLDSKTATCAVLDQKLSESPAQNTNPSSVPVTAADRAHLLKMYNYRGCNENSDNRYVYPDESLEINAKLNHQPVPPIKGGI